MKHWSGSAGVCVNESKQILMVLQGKPEEKKVWSVTSGGQEEGETLEECCIREIHEETGYRAKVIRKLFEKKGTHLQTEFTVTYYEVEKVGGAAAIQDPDGLIYEVAWKSASELEDLELAFPEDRSFLLDYLKQIEPR
ncbi:NUDIX hydrolase [Paenibacillus residui]|uniref:NUDIX hydrolase n=1 Tax=Paenibacillus residui TaxID=629724 RepID=A0ABW3DD36_9BACL